MKVEREIAGIALPFAAGAIASVYLGMVFFSTHPIAAVVPFLAIISALTYLHHSGEEVHAVSGRIAVAIAMTACGWVCGITDTFLAFSQTINHGWLEAVALDLCSRTEAVINSIPFQKEETGEIVKALITGEKSGIPGNIKEAFRNSGASHILALSGLHLGIIYGILRGMLFFIGNSSAAKNLKSIILVLVCGFYTLATGSGPSIMRAFTFITIGEYANFRKYKMSLPLVMMSAMMIQIVLSPSSITEIGFQLSYAAVAGIAFIFPVLQGFWPGDRNDDSFMTKCARWIWDSAAISISCQITTGPLAYIYFRSFPVHFILTNIIAVPLCGIIIPSVLLTIVLHSIGWCPEIITRASELLITALSEALHIISSM